MKANGRDWQGFLIRVHEGKTRLIEFGRFAAKRRACAGLGRPETFDFLGFTQYCGKTRKGAFMVKRKTQAKRMTRKLEALRHEMKARQHAPVKTQRQWLCQVLRGHYGYYGVIFNSRSLHAFYDGVKRAWFSTLRRRSQKSRMTWQRFNELLRVYPLPRPVIHQSWHGGHLVAMRTTHPL